ncbi:hypothetical protein LMH87_004049 [Akanthomyces muscarius]|uniref:Uncharacterized protein n=2 Tax=Akanthomyces muscarius TaxID=2231603 RepID=A0A9W8Q4L7_AKAMU|nr:hypothetical protein LMH87_004049 [Akanthomyces muscarius]KAJ4145194.1 hypothetical protein LMH87_004049 [Akanthomyces muscarius]
MTSKPSSHHHKLKLTTTKSHFNMETLPSSATEHRHLPHARGNPSKSSSDPWQSHRHQVRAIAKKLAAADDPFTCQKLSFMCALNGGLAADAATPCPAFTHKHASVRTHHFELQLQGGAGKGGELLGIASSSMLDSRPVAAAAAASTSIYPGQRGGGARRTFKRDRYTPADLDDDVTLAKSKVPMPCDDNSQNTVRAAASPAPTSSSNVQTESVAAVADKAEVAALYETGLLYKDASPRGRGVTLDSIAHDEPTYVMRSAKPRARKQHGGRPRGTAALSDLDLALNLSFSDLGDEESVVQYLMALTASEADAADASSTLSSPTLRALQGMDDASSEAWVVLDNKSA